VDARRLIDVGSKTVQFCSFGRFPFHESKARGMAAPLCLRCPLYLPPDLGLLSLSSFCFLISKDVDFVELPGIPRGFLKRRHQRGCSEHIDGISEGKASEDPFIRATLLIFNLGRFFVRRRFLKDRRHNGALFVCHQSCSNWQKDHKIT